MSYFDLPEINTLRTRLRKIALTDADAMFAFSSKEIVTRFLSYQHTTKVDAIAYIEKKQAGYERGDCLIWGIEEVSSHQYIGNCGFTHWDIQNASLELGFTISDSFWGKGLATEVVAAVIDYGFKQMHANRIEGRCFLGNTGSEKVMEKLGMSFEGVLRQQVWVKDQFRDLKMYSLLRNEYAGEPRIADSQLE